MNWNPVNSYEDVPMGVWLVKLEVRQEDANPYQVLQRHPKCSIIGHFFAFDEARVIAYSPFEALL